MAVLLQQKIDHALLAVDAFCNLLEDETKALNTSNFTLFESLQDRKVRLAQAYQDALLAFEEEVEHLQALDENVKDKLRASHARFSVVAEYNQSALSTAKHASERIVSLIMDAARQTVMDTPNYGATGSRDLSEKIPVHFKLNEVL